LYSKTHEWLKFLDDGTVLIGLDDYAQKALGDLVFLDAPAEGDSVSAGEPFADIESIKAVSPIYSHVTGTIIEVNQDVADDPRKINDDPYGSWIIKVGDISQKGDLIEADEHEKLCAEEA
jgi:glycine cleavage system H protein